MSLPLESRVPDPRWRVPVRPDGSYWYAPVTSPIAGHGPLGDQHLSPGGQLPCDRAGFGVRAVS